MCKSCVLVIRTNMKNYRFFYHKEASHKVVEVLANYTTFQHYCAHGFSLIYLLKSIPGKFVHKNIYCMDIYSE